MWQDEARRADHPVQHAEAARLSLGGCGGGSSDQDLGAEVIAARGSWATRRNQRMRKAHIKEGERSKKEFVIKEGCLGKMGSESTDETSLWRLFTGRGGGLNAESRQATSL